MRVPRSVAVGCTARNSGRPRTHDKRSGQALAVVAAFIALVGLGCVPEPPGASTTTSTVPSSTVPSSTVSTTTTTTPTAVPYPGAQCVALAASTPSAIPYVGGARFSSDGRFLVMNFGVDLLSGGTAVSMGRYLIDRQLQLICRVASGSGSLAISSNGRYVATRDETEIRVLDMTTGSFDLVAPSSGLDGSYAAGISDDGRYVTFMDGASGGPRQIDRTTSVTSGVLGSGGIRSVSRDGSRILMTSNFPFASTVWFRDGTPSLSFSDHLTAPMADPDITSVFYNVMPDLRIVRRDVATDTVSTAYDPAVGGVPLGFVYAASNGTSFMANGGDVDPGPCRAVRVSGGVIGTSVAHPCRVGIPPTWTGQGVIGVSADLSVVATLDLADGTLWFRS